MLISDSSFLIFDIPDEMAQTFRKTFSLPNYDVIRWFPGHMAKSMGQMQSQLKNTDCVIEIHDARIPFSGRNPRFSDMIALRPHILLLNKFDLCNKGLKGKVADKLHCMGVENVLFTNCLEFRTKEIQNELMPMIFNAINSRPRYRKSVDYNIMVIGVPNTGKSTFINAFRRMHTTRKRNVAQTGAIAGITRSVNNRIKVHFNPDMFLVDTPGILTPYIPNIDSGMRLSLCGCLPDHLVGEHYIVDYMLYWLNKQKRFSYIEKFELQEPTDNVMSFLSHIAKQQSMVKKIKDINNPQFQHAFKPNFEQAAQYALKIFRKGQLGNFTIDSDLL